MADEVSTEPRLLDVQQLQDAYALHRSECPRCKSGPPCRLTTRLRRALAVAGERL